MPIILTITRGTSVYVKSACVKIQQAARAVNPAAFKICRHEKEFV